MRRATAFIALALGGAAPAFAQEMRDLPASWRLVAAGADGHSLQLVYEAGGCSQGDGRAVVTETKATIDIEVRHTYADGAACPANSISKGLTVRLAAPIEGRFISGPNRSGPPGMRLGRVPRVRGLSQPDAARLLAEHGYHVRTRGRYTAGKVISQRPRAGTRLRARRTVTLRFTYARR